MNEDSSNFNSTTQEKISQIKIKSNSKNFVNIKWSNDYLIKTSTHDPLPPFHPSFLIPLPAYSAIFFSWLIIWPVATYLFQNFFGALPYLGVFGVEWIHQEERFHKPRLLFLPSFFIFIFIFISSSLHPSFIHLDHNFFLFSFPSFLFLFSSFSFPFFSFFFSASPLFWHLEHKEEWWLVEWMSEWMAWISENEREGISPSGFFFQKKEWKKAKKPSRKLKGER